MSVKTVAKTASAIACMVALAACAQSNPLEVTISDCPAVAVVGDMGSYTRIKNDSGMAEDIELMATINNLRSKCSENSQIITEVMFDVSALAGPAFSGKSVVVDYFVLTLKDNNHFVSKDTYQATLVFDQNGRAVSPQQVIHTVATKDNARRYDYEILVALKMTPTEVMFNIEQ